MIRVSEPGVLKDVAVKLNGELFGSGEMVATHDWISLVPPPEWFKTGQNLMLPSVLYAFLPTEGSLCPAKMTIAT